MPRRLQALSTSPWRVALLIGLAAQLLFTINLDGIGKLVFDETHYIPAARAIGDLAWLANPEHPMLGKTLLAIGIALFGDTPWGWRIMPTLAGTATVLAGFACLWLLTRSMRAATTAAGLLMLNQTLFVQARNGMLDVFLGAFIAWALVALLWAAHGTPAQVRRRWLLGSALLGLACGVKWAAIPYVALAGAAFLVLRLRDHLPQSGWLRRTLSAQDQPHWPGLGTIPGLLILGVVSVAAYLLTFAPGFLLRTNPITFATLLPIQLDMYAAQTQVLAAHTYQSDWWSWPLMLRPIWFFYEEWSGAWRGVLLIGNPVVMWGGLAAVAACGLAWVRDGAFRPLALALLWLASVAVYAIIPKSLGFYYYYHLSGIFLCLAIAIALHHFDRGRARGREEWVLAAALIAFLWFYPILSGLPLSGPQAFTRWMLLDSWR